MISYAYIFCRPDSSPFYVGKGTLARSKWLKGRNPYCQRVIDKYGPENILIGLLECSSEEIAFELEKGLIKCFKRMGVELTNMTDGGEGPSGNVLSEETRRKIGIASFGRNFGRKHTEKAKEKIRQAELGSRNHMARTVKETNSGLIFTCMREAARYFNISHHDVGISCEINKGNAKYVKSRERLNNKLQGLNFIHIGGDNASES